MAGFEVIIYGRFSVIAEVFFPAYFRTLWVDSSGGRVDCLDTAARC